MSEIPKIQGRLILPTVSSLSVGLHFCPSALCAYGYGPR